MAQGGTAGLQASRRAGVTAIDQAVSSASNFAVGVAVARISGEAGLGAFSVAYALWLALAFVHRSLVAEPMAIEGDARVEDDAVGVQRGLAAEVLVGVAASACVAAIGLVLLLAGSHEFGVALVAVAPWLPALAAQDYWRWVGFMRGRPGSSLVNDIVFAAAQIVAFGAIFFTGIDNSALVIGSWGLGGLVGALFGLRQFHVRPSLRGGWTLLRERWKLGKWLLANASTVWMQGQAYVFFIGAVLGPAAVGGLRAAQTLVQGPTMVLIQAGGSVGLPEASKAYDERGWPGLKKVSAVITGAGMATLGLFGAVVVVFGGPLLRALYGPGFDSYAPAASLFAVAYLAASFTMGSTIVLKVARQPMYLFYVSVVQLATFTIALVTLTAWVGTNGAPLATLLAMVVYDVVVIYYRRKTVAQMLPEVRGDLALADGDTPPVPAARPVLVPVEAALGHGGGAS
jgi:O-antigen/teichoic acid export membrane protein